MTTHQPDDQANPSKHNSYINVFADSVNSDARTASQETNTDDPRLDSSAEHVVKSCAELPQALAQAEAESKGAEDLKGNTSPFAHISPEAPTGTAGDLSWLFIRTMAVIAAFGAGSLLVATPETAADRTLVGLIFITIFYLGPRLFYHRYQVVYLNEELRTHFKPKGLWRRFIYATRRLLSGRIMLVLSALMALYLIATGSKEGTIILTLSTIAFTLVNLFLGTRTGIKLFHAEAIPAIYPFYRRWTSIIVAALTAAVAALFFQSAPISSAQALRLVGASLSSSGTEPTALLYDTLNLTAALKNYVCSLASGTVWELPAILLLVMLPYGILGLNTGLGISMLSLSRAEYGFLLGSHHWVKTDRTIWNRYWKSVALPIFLISFFATAWTLGAPYYQTYLAKSKLVATSKAQTASYEKIGTYYCKAGTVREISALRSQALTQIDQLLTKASNEVNATFTDNTAKLPIFVNWYIGRHEKYPFKPGDEQLRAALKTGLDLDNIYIKVNNIRRELSNNVANVYTTLGQDVMAVLKQNSVEASVAEKNPDHLMEFKETDILAINTPYGDSHGFFTPFRLEEPLPDFTRDVLNSVNDPKAPWFLPVGSIEVGNDAIRDGISANAQLAENDLIGDDASRATETAIQVIDKGSLLAYITSLLEESADKVNDSFAKGVGLKTEEENNATAQKQALNASGTDGASLAPNATEEPAVVGDQNADEVLEQKNHNE